MSTASVLDDENLPLAVCKENERFAWRFEWAFRLL